MNNVGYTISHGSDGQPFVHLIAPDSSGRPVRTQIVPAASGALYQPTNSILSSLSGLATSGNSFFYFTAPNIAAIGTITAAGRDLVDDADAAAQRSTLGLGTMATQNAGAIAITGGSITGMSSPSGSSDVVTKGYVDTLIAGLKWKQTVVAATTAAVTLASALENGDTVDGVILETGDRILVKDQADPKENGIYVVAMSGAPARASDADTGTELVSAAVFVTSGTVNADRAWVCTTNAITIGVTNITWTGFASIIGALVAANNLSDLLSAPTARTNLGIGNVENTALSTWTGSTNLTTVGTIITGAWHGTLIGVLYGGTGADMSGTGATGFLVKQSGVGSALTAGLLTIAELASVIQAKVLTADFDNASAGPAYANVTGADFSLLSGATYVFIYLLTTDTAIVTTSAVIGVDGPTNSLLSINTIQPNVLNNLNAIWKAATAYNSGATPAASGGTTDAPNILFGSVVTTAAGTLNLTLKNSAGSSRASILKGSIAILIRTA